MLAQLSIRNILLIDALDLHFDKGLNVLTGETGAGKSILLDSLGFVLGWRGPANLVRDGADQGEVEAVFELDKNHLIWRIFDEAEFAIEREEPIIFRRLVNRDGRKRAFVNDRPASTELVRQLGDALVESHGQHDDKGLLDEKNHIKLLDAFGDYDLEPMRDAYRDYVQAEMQLRSFQERLENNAREADYLRHSVEELSLLNVQAGEVEALDQKRRLMQKGEKLAGEISALMQILSAENSTHLLVDALRRTQALVGQLDGALDEAANALEIAVDQVAIAEHEISALAEALDFDPKELEATEERLFAIRAAERKYQVEADKLPLLLAQFQTDIEAMDDQQASQESLESNFKKARENAEAQAKILHELRVLISGKLDQYVMNELAPLKLERAIFETEIGDKPLAADGRDQVRFVVKTNPGAPAGPISKIASGGELSRFLLALKVSLHQGDDKTLLFDEIDRGVGGQTADAVGRRLRALASSSQLLIVTHSPQVAALGERQFVVQKIQSTDVTTTTVKPVEGQARIEEIARMISGDQISSEAIAAAQKLVEAGSVESKV